MKSTTRNPDAEKALVASLLIAPERTPDVARLVQPQHFFDALYRATYAAICDLHAAGRIVEPVAVVEAVRASRVPLGEQAVEILMEAGMFFREIAGNTATGAHAVHYAGIVATTGIRRQLEAKSAELVGCRDDEERSEVVREMTDLAAELGRAQDATRGFVTMREESLKFLESLRQGDRTLVSLGLPDLDYAIGGGAAFGEMVVVAARPSNGKTLFAVQLVEQLAAQGYPGFILSEEMSARLLAERSIGHATERPKRQWREHVADVAGEVDLYFGARAPIWIAESCATVDVAIRKVERAAANGARVAAIDYAQLIRGKGKTQYERVSDVSVEFKKAATRLDILLLLLCQLSRPDRSRKTYQEPGRKEPRGVEPALTDLRDSGQIEQDADVVVFLQWPLKNNPRYKPADEFFFYVAKCRNRGIHRGEVRAKVIPSRQMIVPANGSGRSRELFEAENGHASTLADLDY